MKNNKFLSVAMAAVMLTPVFTACSLSGKTGAGVVRADDPWYESTKFELVKNFKKNESETCVDYCVSNDRIFSLYGVTPDGWANVRTVLDTYDYEGNLLNRQTIDLPDELQLYDVCGSTVDPEGKTIKTVIQFAAYQDTAFVEIDVESGTVTNMKELIGEAVKRRLKPESELLFINSSGKYTLAVMWHPRRTGESSNRQLLLFKDGEFVQVLEPSNVSFMALMDGFSVDESANSVFVGVYTMDDNLSLEFDIATGQQKSARSFLETGGETLDFAEYTATADGDLCKIDSLGNIISIDTGKMTPKTIIDANWYTPYFYPRIINL